jgi:hypothetical protein
MGKGKNEVGDKFLAASQQNMCQASNPPPLPPRKKGANKMQCVGQEASNLSLMPMSASSSCLQNTQLKLSAMQEQVLNGV